MDTVPFRVDAETIDNVVRLVEVHGELDLGTAPEFENALESAAASPDARIVVDLSNCGFVDSTGIALIIGAWRAVAGPESKAGGRLVLSGIGDQVERLFEITGLLEAIDVFATSGEAVAALSAD